MDVEKAVAILLTNLKGSKKKPSDIFTISKAVHVILDEWGLKKASNFFEISQYQLRQFDKLYFLSPEVKKVIKQKKLGIESAYQISRLDEKKQIPAIKATQGLRSHEMRQFVHLIKKNEDLDLHKAKKMVEKTLRGNFHLIVLPLTLQTHNDLQKKASKSNMKIHDFILNILENYLHGKKEKI